MRLFVALEIPSTVRDDFAALMNDLRALESKSSAKKPRWVRPENLHVTLKFIGHVEPEKLDPIRAALAKAELGKTGRTSNSADSASFRTTSVLAFSGPALLARRIWLRSPETLTQVSRSSGFPPKSARLLRT